MMGERRGPTFDQTVTGPGCPEMNIRFVDPVKSSGIGVYHIFRMRGSNELRHDVESDDDGGGSRAQPAKNCVRW